jgi:hypothetical protein
VRVIKGAQSTITVLTFLNNGYNPCIMVQNVQYPDFSAPLCWTETVAGSATSFYPPVLTALANHSFVVAYPFFIYGTNTVALKAQTFALTCGDGFIGPDEQCDSTPNCNFNCMCAPNYYPSNGECIFALSTPVAINPDVVPILDCFVALNQTHVRGYFSHENLQQLTAVVPIGPKNSFSVIGQVITLQFKYLAVGFRHQNIRWNI